MKKQFLSLFVLAFTCLLYSVAYAGEDVTITPEVPGYLALPEGTEGQPVAAVVLIHEWWGLNDQIRGQADRFAKNGFAALAVNLYRGNAAENAEEAHELMRGLPDDRALEDMKAAVTFLRNHAAVNPERIGVIGWCMGGGYALKLALSDERIAAVNIYYGKLITDEKELAKLRAPLLGIFGAEDRGISKESVAEFKNKLDSLEKRSEIVLYLNAGHAFANSENPGYNAQAAKEAWEKTQVFFRSNLA